MYSLLASNRGGLFIIFLPLYLIDVKGASVPAALILVSLAYVVASLISPWVGRLSDQRGRRRPFLLFGEAAALPLFLAMVFAPGYLASGILFIAAELALAVGGPAYTAFVADVTRTGERAYGYGLLNATSNAGGVAGFLAAGVLVFFYGLSILLPFVVAVMIGTLSVVVFLVPDMPVGSPPMPRRSMRELRPVLSFSVAVSVRAIGSGAVAFYAGYYAAHLGANGFEVGLVAIAGLLTAALVSLPLGRWMDRRGEIRGIFYGTLLSIASYTFVLLATRWEEILPAQSIRNAGLALVGPGMQAWVARTAAPGQRAEALGVFALVNSTLWSVGPLVGAVAFAIDGTVGLITMAMATTVISLGLMEWLYGEMGLKARLGGAPPLAPSSP
jgi:DHA1 family multidrug resistance protein-like MFS transporter